MRKSYAYFPRNYLDILSSLHDYEDLLEQSKEIGFTFPKISKFPNKKLGKIVKQPRKTKLLH